MTSLQGGGYALSLAGFFAYNYLKLQQPAGATPSSAQWCVAQAVARERYVHGRLAKVCRWCGGQHHQGFMTYAPAGIKPSGSYTAVPTVDDEEAAVDQRRKS